jgi:peptide deformylase
MDIVYYPDPVLQRRAAASGRSPADLRAFIDGMIDAMVEAHGVGLAAPQVGEGLRLFVASETGNADDAIAFLDPRIEPFGPIVEMEEGCLSLPGIRADIRRPESVRVTFTDLDGREQTEEFHELMARIIQHEFDHLDGILFFERMSETDRLRIRPDLAALEEQYVPR